MSEMRSLNVASDIPIAHFRKALPFFHSGIDSSMPSNHSFGHEFAFGHATYSSPLRGPVHIVSL